LSDRFAEPEDPLALALEVVLPLMPPRVEQRYQLARQRVNTRDVRTFVKVAVVAGEREVIENVRASVLSGDDMFDMESEVPVGGL